MRSLLCTISLVLAGSLAGCAAPPHGFVGSWSATTLPEGLATGDMDVSEDGRFSIVITDVSGGTFGLAGDWEAASPTTANVNITETPGEPGPGTATLIEDELTMIGHDGTVATFTRDTDSN
ncbi:MAG: hypothetical protein AAGB34_00750 [Planctomycetota bacterium]